MFTTHRPTLTLQLHNFDLFVTCRTALLRDKLARFQLTRRIARSLGDSLASCTVYPARMGASVCVRFGYASEMGKEIEVR